MAKAARAAAREMGGVASGVREGSGSGSGAGKGAGKGSGDGTGTAEGSGSGMGTGPGDSHGNLPPDAPGASLYSPRTTPTSGEKTHVSTMMRKGGGPTVSTSEKAAPDRTSDSRVPYYEVVGDYSKQAEEALSREEVPPAYRSTVKGYFNALQPGGDRAKPGD
jgi:hypothetical protein